MVKDKATLIGLVLSALFIVIVIVVTATQRAPYLMGNSLLCLGLSIVFIATEQASWGWWHRYRESENRFWCFVAFLFSTGVLFASDSPLNVGQIFPKMGFSLIFLFTFFVHQWERALTRESLGVRPEKTPKLSHGFTSRMFTSQDLVMSAKEKLKRVEENLDKLDFKIAAFKMYHQRDILKNERDILYTLSSATTQELNYILTHVNLPLLFYKIKDNDIYTPARFFPRTRLISKTVRTKSSKSIIQNINLNPNPFNPTTLIPGRDSPDIRCRGPSQSSRESPGSSSGWSPPGNGLKAMKVAPLVLPVSRVNTTPSTKLELQATGYIDRDEDGEDDSDTPQTPSRLFADEYHKNTADYKSLDTTTDDDTTGMDVRFASDTYDGVKDIKVVENLAVPNEIGGKEEAEKLGTVQMAGDADDGCLSRLCGGNNPEYEEIDIELDPQEFDEKNPGKHHRVISYRNRTHILNLVAYERLPELTVVARSSVLSALQRMPLSAHPKGEFLASNVIINTCEEDLRTLKYLLDDGGDVHNLHKLVFSDMRDASIREKVLSHLKREAKQVLEYRNALKSSSLPFPNSLATRPTLRKILSDVDDTLFSSGGRFPAGIDNKFEHHALYPGVLTFYKELDIGLADRPAEDEWPKSWKGNLAFLSARPHVYKDWSQKKSYQLFNKLRKTHGLHTTPTLLAGELFSSFQMFRGDFDPMANKKVQNFLEFSALYPEYTFVFIGDNGQGDVSAAEKMIQSHKDRIEAVFIHKVQDLTKTPGFKDGSIQLWEDLGIVFFETYVGAALEACKRKLLRPSGLQMVANKAVQEFTKLKFHNEEQRFLRLQELNRDIEECNEFLISHEYKQVGYVMAKHAFACGSLVRVKQFGLGRVVHFRYHDGIYEIASVKMKNTRIYTLGRSLNWAFRGSPGDRVWTPYGTGVLERAREIDGVHVVNLATKKPISTLYRRSDRKDKQKGTKAYLQPTHIRVIKAAVGDRVTTAFGKGLVQSFRNSDGMYEVLIPWGRQRRETSRKYDEKKMNRSMSDGFASTKRGYSPNVLKNEKVVSGVIVRAYLVASQIHRADVSGATRCLIS